MHESFKELLTKIADMEQTLLASMNLIPKKIFQLMGKGVIMDIGRKSSSIRGAWGSVR